MSTSTDFMDAVYDHTDISLVYARHHPAGVSGYKVGYLSVGVYVALAIDWSLRAPVLTFDLLHSGAAPTSLEDVELVIRDMSTLKDAVEGLLQGLELDVPTETIVWRQHSG